LVGAVIGIGTYQLSGRSAGAHATANAPTPSRTATALQAQLSSFDPSGGSGFRQDGKSWRTQTYRSATFGGLKPGVGLILDVGTAQQISGVSLDAGPGQLTMQLRAGDGIGSDLSTFSQVGPQASASGPTTLPADGGGKHRYWMIWVTGLASSGGGYSAAITNAVALSPLS
jgi:hypothetical protein